MVVVGDKVLFDPFETLTGFGSEVNRGNMVTGTVVSVNYANKWFSVEYGNYEEYGIHKLRTSFKFCDIGEAVMVCGK